MKNDKEGRIATASDIGHWLRNDSFLGSAVQVRQTDRGVRPYTGEGPRCAAGRADVGIGPYEKLHKVWYGGRTQGSLLREFAERYA